MPPPRRKGILPVMNQKRDQAARPAVGRAAARPHPLPALSLAVALGAAALALCGAASAQVPSSAYSPKSLPSSPGVTPTQPTYGSNVGLPYGAGAPQQPFAYGANRPTQPGAAYGAGTVPQTTTTTTTAPGAPGTRPTTGGAAVSSAAPTLEEQQQGAAGTGAGALGVAPITNANQAPNVGLGTARQPSQQGLPRSTSTAPGYDTPFIKPAPDYLPGDAYAKRPGSPVTLPPAGGGIYRPPYTVDSTGNYFNPNGNYTPNGTFNPTGTYRGTVDSQGRVYDQYGIQRGVVNR